MTRGGEDMEVVGEEVEVMGVEVEELTIALTEDPEVLVVVVVEDLLQMEAEMETRYFGLSHFYLFNARQNLQKRVNVQPLQKPGNILMLKKTLV